MVDRPGSASTSTRPTAKSRVVAVVVSYNRRELLAEALKGLAAQTHPLHRTIVVDNASTDGSSEAAGRVAPTAQVVRLASNTGGAGGFTAGIALALAAGAEWIWLMDDDTIPRPDALEQLVRAAHESGSSVLGSRVVWTDGRDHPMNRPKRWPLARRDSVPAGCVPVRSTSFVSMLVAADAVRRRGLPVADYFIWNDDFEYSSRLIRGGIGCYVSASVVEHKTARRVSSDDDPGDRFYFEVRNKVWLFRLSDAFRLWEKCLYGASTIVRWGRTFVRSQDRARLVSALRRGLRDGWRKTPRTNRVVLDGVDSSVDAALDQLELLRGSAPR